MRSLYPVLEQMTPTQELLLDVLQARHRLGEAFWTFSTKIRPVIRQLEAGGWLFTMSGVTENTMRAGLTPAAKRELFHDSTYVSPLERENLNLADQIERMLPAIPGPYDEKSYPGRDR